MRALRNVYRCVSHFVYTRARARTPGKTRVTGLEMSANAFDTYKFGECVCLVVCAVRLVNEASPGRSRMQFSDISSCVRGPCTALDREYECMFVAVDCAAGRTGRAKALYSAVYFWPCELFSVGMRHILHSCQSGYRSDRFAAIDCCCIALGILGRSLARWSVDFGSTLAPNIFCSHFCFNCRYQSAGHPSLGRLFVRSSLLPLRTQPRNSQHSVGVSQFCECACTPRIAYAKCE